MNSNGIPLTTAAGIMAASIIAGTAVAAQRTAKADPPNHDGVYAVQIVTERGTCDKSYLWTIAITGGHISSTGNTPMEATGEINRQGVVSLAFRRFNDVALVAGRVKGSQGAGTWQSPTMACSGTWRAMRQS